MDSKLISYDLFDADYWEYDILYDELKSLNAAHIQESVWVIPYDDDAIKLAQYLAPCLHSKDRLNILSYQNNDYYNYNALEQNRFMETVNAKASPSDFDWGSKLTRKQ